MLLKSAFVKPSLPILAATALLLSGCGQPEAEEEEMPLQQEPRTGGAPELGGNDPQPDAADQVGDDGGEAAGAEEGIAVEAVPDDAGEAPTAEVARELRVRAAKARAEELILRGEFTDARSRVQELVAAYPRFRESLELSRMLRDVTVHQQRAGGVRFAVAKLSTFGTIEMRAARGKFERAGETALIVLAKAVREEDDAIAKAALELLDDLDPAAVPDACAQRLEARPDSELRPFCVDRVRNALQDVSPFGARLLCRAAAAQRERAGGPELRQIAARRLVMGVDASSLRSLILRIRAGDDPQQSSILPFLGALYHFATGRSDAEFLSMCPDERALADLRHAAGMMRDGDDPEEARAGRKAVGLFMPFDDVDLADGLAGRWLFGTPKWPFLGGDVEEEYLSSEGFSVGRETAESAVAGNYSISAWIRPSARPTGEQPTPFWVIARKSEWSMVLLMAADGRLVFIHALAEGEAPVTCFSSTRIGVGQWAHVAVVVDRRNGRARLLVNGTTEAESEFAANGKMARDEDPERPFRVLALPPGSADQCRFRGDAGDIRLYSRSLSADDVRALLRCGILWD